MLECKIDKKRKLGYNNQFIWKIPSDILIGISGRKIRVARKEAIIKEMEENFSLLKKNAINAIQEYVTHLNTSWCNLGYLQV